MEKINEVTQVKTLSSGEFINGITSDGSLIKIKVSDLVSALNESNTSLSKGLLYRGSINYDKYDTTLISGIYNVQGKSGGSGVLEDYGCLLVFNPFSTQIFLRANSPYDIIFRNKLSTGWTVWKKIQFSNL